MWLGEQRGWPVLRLTMCMSVTSLYCCPLEMEGAIGCRPSPPSASLLGPWVAHDAFQRATSARTSGVRYLLLASRAELWKKRSLPATIVINPKPFSDSRFLMVRSAIRAMPEEANASSPASIVAARVDACANVAFAETTARSAHFGCRLCRRVSEAGSTITTVRVHEELPVERYRCRPCLPPSVSSDRAAHDVAHRAGASFTPPAPTRTA